MPEDNGRDRKEDACALFRTAVPRKRKEILVDLMLRYERRYFPDGRVDPHPSMIRVDRLQAFQLVRRERNARTSDVGQENDPAIPQRLVRRLCHEGAAPKALEGKAHAALCGMCSYSSVMGL